MTGLLALAPLAPLAAAALILLGRRAAAPLALLGAGASLYGGARLLSSVAAGATASLALPGLPGLPLALTATPLTALLSVLVATIALFVLTYATGYMTEDPERKRFFATMLLFVAAMQTLVLAGDWILLLAAWEVIGLASYLLIGFWHDRPGVPAAATRAFLTTRAADLGLYAAAFLLIGATGTNAITQATHPSGPAALAAGLLLLLAAMGKSAQTPLHGWLQDAMAGPTPVSALLHSATLVAAGAILLIRTAPLLPPAALLAAGLVGGTTTVITGLIAFAERDLKRLLAASTSSQYGLMLLAVGAGYPLAALLLLIAHAAIKSSLFLASGVFQHSRDSTRLDDLRGIAAERPLAYAGFTLAALALAGIPPLSGFLAKDAVIAATLASPRTAAFATLALAGTLLTGAYMGRALHALWHGQPHPRPLAGIGWMIAGLTGLVALAATLALAFPGIRTLLGQPLPETVAAKAAGLSAALTGLALGWLLRPERALGPLLPWAQRGFRIGGGLSALTVKSALTLARACDRTETLLYGGVLAAGRAGMAVARAAQASDDLGLDALIAALARGANRLGARLRTLQSGLIHRELALATAGAALLVASLAIALLAAPAIPPR